MKTKIYIFLLTYGTAALAGYALYDPAPAAFHTIQFAAALGFVTAVFFGFFSIVMVALEDDREDVRKALWETGKTQSERPMWQRRLFSWTSRGADLLTVGVLVTSGYLWTAFAWVAFWITFYGASRLMEATDSYEAGHAGLSWHEYEAPLPSCDDLEIALDDKDVA